MKLKLQDTTAESLSLAGAHRVNRNNVGTFLKFLDKGATEDNLSDTSRNICNFDESGIQNN